MQLHMLQTVKGGGTADARGIRFLRRKDGMLLAALLMGDERRRCSTLTGPAAIAIEASALLP